MKRPPRCSAFCALCILCISSFGEAPPDSVPPKSNQLDIGMQVFVRGEIRDGGVADAKGNPAPTTDDHASFINERTRLTIGFSKIGKMQLDAKITAQHAGVWGQSGKGNFNLYETWVKLGAKGAFAQIGRQLLAYDDERIIGSNDWTMAALSHDVLRLGYEGYGHKAHAILAYNQNAANINGGTFYVNGAQPYKNMQVGWYHYDLPRTPLGASILFMNIGMQGGTDGGEQRTIYQQLIGAYAAYRPRYCTLSASYYHQLGKNEDGIKIDAWMASALATVKPSERYGFLVGFDYLSGDKYFAVPAKGALGLTQHKVIKGFNPLYGSHHKFYGAMDFFYVTTYVGGFTPGLQNLYFGVYGEPVKKLVLNANYHYLATATKLNDMNMTLGHEIELQATYTIMKEVRLSAGFSYMTGTETMERLKRVSTQGNLRWGWISVNVTPTLFSTKW